MMKKQFRFKILIHDAGLHRHNWTNLAWSWFCELIDFFNIITVRTVVGYLDYSDIYWLVIPSYRGKSMKLYKPITLALMKCYQKKGDRMIAHIHDDLKFLGEKESIRQLKTLGLKPMNFAVHTSKSYENDTEWVNMHFPLFPFTMRKK